MDYDPEWIAAAGEIIDSSPPSPLDVSFENV
jgi:hypothetical protein